MKKTKKLMSILLVLIMVIGTMTLGVSASEEKSGKWIATWGYITC